MPIGTRPRLGMDPKRRSYRYFRNAVERHWDPHEIDVAGDRERVADLPAGAFDDLRRLLALFGAAEQAVAEDLAPLAVVLGDPNDQLFVTSQLYEEAKHADFFGRYWREVVHHAEDARGEARSRPTDDRWFSEAYDELMERTAAAMHRLLETDTPESRADAYCHYHLVLEGLLAQTGYHAVQTDFSGEFPDLPRLPGLVAGFTAIRGDEGRHVGFGMAKLEAMVDAGRVSPEYLHGAVNELVPIGQELIERAVDADTPGLGPDALLEYAAGHHVQRMKRIVRDDATVPGLGELTRIEDQWTARR